MTAYYNIQVRELGNPDILMLGEITRYNNKFKIRNENVAEHSFYVCTTVLKICDMYDLSNEVKAKALEFAVVHDIPEAITGDIGYDTKEGNEALKQALEKSELKGLKKYMPEYLEKYKQFLKEEKEETLPYLVVKLADAVSVLQYSNLEIELGNRTYSMRAINEGAVDRVTKLIEKLEKKIKNLESNNE